MNDSIKIMIDAIVDILDDNIPSIYLYGSVVSEDFKFGWSDIDILCLTRTPITDEQANELVSLRQALQRKHPNNQYLGLFEGELLSLDGFINDTPDKIVYWGSSGQRINEKSYFDSFSLYQLKTYGQLVYGDEIRDSLTMPTYEQLKKGVVKHYNAIRKYALTTNRSIKSVGWLLDIARGLYTIRTGKVIAKTDAGEWALENNICPVRETLLTAIKIRKNPVDYMNDNEILDWSQTIGDDIQRFADVLENELTKLPILQGNIIRLRPIDIEKDKYHYYDVSQDEKMHEWTGNTVPKTVEEIEKLLQIYNELLHVWMIEEKEDNKVIGMMRLSFPEEQNGLLVAGDSQRLHSDYWRRGHMKEARRLIYDYAFNTLGIDMLYADALKDNINSCKSLESVGYVVYDTKEEFNQKHNKNLIKQYYKLTKDDWLRQIGGDSN